MADKDSKILPSEDAQDTPCYFKELVSTMEPNCLADTLSVYLESCEPFSVTDPEPPNNLDEPDISQTDALVNPFNSIALSESSEPRDNDGKDSARFHHTSEKETHEIKCSSTRRSTRKITPVQKTDTKLGVRKCRRTGKRPMLDLLLMDVGRRRRSGLVQRARASVWGLGENIEEIFKQNEEKNVNDDENIETRKGRTGRRGGKRNTDLMNQRIQISMGESRALNKGLLLKLKLGTKAIQNCQFNTIPDMEKGHESYREVRIEASNLQSDIKENYEEELPSASTSRASNENLDKGMVPPKTSVINTLLADRDTSNAVVGKGGGEIQDIIGMGESVENRCLDPGTSPDSEVINVIPETQISGIASEGLHDIRISSQDCAGRQSGDCGVGSGIPSPEIINDVLSCDMYEHGEKLIEGSCSSGASVSITTRVASSTPSCREGCPMEPMTSLQETEVGLPMDVLTIESGRQTDLSIAGIESVDSRFLEKLLPVAKSNVQNLQKSSRSRGTTKSRSEVPDSVNKKKTNCQQKGSQAKPTAKGKIKEKNGNDQGVCDVESHPVTGNHETDDVGGPEEGCRSTAGALSNSTMVPSEGESQQGSPRSAWVCCDDCHKWRRIPAILADSIESTECRWICKDNVDKGFADCSIPQEKSNADINEELEISDASCEEDTCNTRLNSSQLGQKQPIDPPQSSWKLIKTNMFLHRNRKNQTIDEIMVCHCKPPVDGRRGCRDECLNRMLNIECVKGTCPCGEFCLNQQFQKRKYAKLKCFQCGKKGYGLQLQEDIPKGRFLIEYVGEVLDMPAYDARQKEYASKGHKHFYFMTLNGSEVIDACAKGNLGRFINHSCEPNCRTEKWMVNGEVCIGLFAIRDIKKGEELTFDYNYVRVFGAAAKKCVCGSSRCRGFIGGDPLNAETVVLGDSDDECPEPVTFYDNSSNKLGNVLSGISTSDVAETQAIAHLEDTGNEQSPDSLLVTDDNNDDLTIPTESAEREASFERSSSVASASDSKIELTEGLLSTSLKPNDAKSEIASLDPRDHRVAEKDLKGSLSIGEKTKTLLNSPVNFSPDAGDTKKKHKSHTNEKKCVILKPKSRSKLPGQSSKVKRGKSKTQGGNISKLPEIDNKSLVAPHKTKRPVEDSLTGRFEAVQEALSKLLNADGGISRRRDASKGYLKLLYLTAASGHSGNGEGIQSNRDLSMILDAILKTQSRTVLLDIINKNGLQLLHNLMKRYRQEFNKIPILRKLLKVLEYLAETKILTLENIIKPSRLGAESFKESMLSLTEHTDKQVHQIARSFRDRFIPRSARKINWVERDPFIERTEPEPKSFTHSSDRDRSRPSSETAPTDKPTTEPTTTEPSTPSCLSTCTTDLTRPRKRKSRWDQPGDLESPSNKEDVDADAPPGFSSRIINHPSNNPSVMGHPQERYISRLPVSYGVPCSFFRQTEGAGVPGTAFHPFPPLPSYPKEQQSSSPGAFNQRFRNSNTLGRRYFKQQKWSNSNNISNNNYNNNGWNANKNGFIGGNDVNGNGFYQQH